MVQPCHLSYHSIPAAYLRRMLTEVEVRAITGQLARGASLLLCLPRTLYSNPEKTSSVGWSCRAQEKEGLQKRSLGSTRPFHQLTTRAVGSRQLPPAITGFRYKDSASDPTRRLRTPINHIHLHQTTRHQKLHNQNALPSCINSKYFFGSFLNTSDGVNRSQCDGTDPLPGPPAHTSLFPFLS